MRSSYNNEKLISKYTAGTHVKGHQNRKVAGKDMTLGERLNVKADEIATHVLTQMQQNDQYYEEKLGVSTQELHYINRAGLKIACGRLLGNIQMFSQKKKIGWLEPHDLEWKE
jgi:hypothetical protein